MAVRLRLKRMGRRHRPFYRIVAVDRQKQRDSRVIEELGHYDPVNHAPEQQVTLNRERIEYWLGVGAQPTQTVHGLLRKDGIVSQSYGSKPAKS